MQKFRCDAPKMFAQPQPAVVEEKISSDEPGRVKYKTTYWPAMLSGEHFITLVPGQEVAVIGRQGITLLVSPL